MIAFEEAYITPISRLQPGDEVPGQPNAVGLNRGVAIREGHIIHIEKMVGEQRVRIDITYDDLKAMQKIL